MQSKFSVIMTTFVALIAIGAASTLGYLHLKTAAIQGCLEASSFTYVDPNNPGVTTVAPMMDVYDKCMSEKAVK